MSIARKVIVGEGAGAGKGLREKDDNYGSFSLTGGPNMIKP
jgi:hypothetical protein